MKRLWKRLSALTGVGALIAAFLVAGVALPASAAGGSGDPTPYTVAVDGIYLPAGDVFTDASHVNIKTTAGPKSIHFESKYADPNHAEWKNRPFDPLDPRNQFYGQNFIPWSALGVDMKAPYCVTWAQIRTDKGYNEHFGEGGQAPVGTGCSTPPDTVEYGTWSEIALTCDTQVGDVIKRTRTNTVTSYNFDGSVKKTTQVNQSEDYVVTEVDLLSLDCRTEVVPVLPTYVPATGTCVAEVWTPTFATITFPAVENGSWYNNAQGAGEELTGKTVTLDGTSFTFFFVPSEGSKLGALPEGFTEDNGQAVLSVTPNTVDSKECILSETGGDSSAILPLTFIGLLALLGGSVMLIRRLTASV